MRKILIAALLVLAGTAQAQGHGHGHGHRGFGGGQLAGAIIGGVIVGAVIEPSMQPSVYQYQQQVYQYPPQVYYAPSYNDINYQQVQCPYGYQPTYVQNVHRQLIFVGCRNLQ